jgi:hypothetical protein
MIKDTCLLRPTQTPHASCMMSIPNPSAVPSPGGPRIPSGVRLFPHLAKRVCRLNEAEALQKYKITLHACVLSTSIDMGASLP